MKHTLAKRNTDLTAKNRLINSINLLKNNKDQPYDNRFIMPKIRSERKLDKYGSGKRPSKM